MFVLVLFVCLFVSGQAYRYDPESVHEMEISGTRELRKYKYESCNKAAPINFTVLNIGPDPIVVDKLTVEAEVNISTEIKGKIDYKMDLQIKIGSKSFSSLCDLLEPYCEGKDVCAILGNNVPKVACLLVKPPPANGCHCPFEKGVYKLPKMHVPVPQLPYKITGEFKLHFELLQANTQLMCIDLDFCLYDCN